MEDALGQLQRLLAVPLVQWSALPFLAGLVAAALLYALRLEGLAAIAGFLAAVAAIGDFGLEPLTATRKLVLAGAAAALIGILSDLTLKPTRFSAPALGVIFGAAGVWVFWSVLAQKPLAEAALLGAGIVALSVVLVWSTVTLALDPARAGGAGLALGVGGGVAALLAAAPLVASYGFALGSACAGFLVLLIILGPRVQAGFALTLAVSALAALLAVSAALSARLPWVAAAALALAPLLARLPLPSTPLWLQPLLAAIYAGVAAALAGVLAWLAGRGWTW